MSPGLLPEITAPFVDATSEPPQPGADWSSLGWAAIREAENQNMDLVPPYFDRLLSAGCPECGAAWQELLALGFLAPRMHVGEAVWDGGEFNVSTPSRDGILLRAVRVQCHTGHVFDFDAHTGCRRMYQIPWGLALGSMAVVALASYWLLNVGSR